MIINGFGGMESGGISVNNNMRLYRNFAGNPKSSTSYTAASFTIPVDSNMTFTRWLWSSSTNSFRYYSTKMTFSMTVPQDYCYVPLGIEAKNTSAGSGTWTVVSGTSITTPQDNTMYIYVQCYNLSAPYWTDTSGQYTVNNTYPPSAGSSNVDGTQLGRIGHTGSDTPLVGSAHPASNWVDGYTRPYLLPNVTYNFGVVLMYNTNHSSSASTTAVLKRSTGGEVVQILLYRPKFYDEVLVR